VRGEIGNFANAIRKVPGLELIDEEELEADETDKSPEAYLLVPDAVALQNILSLWKRWVAGREMEDGFTPWRDVFATLKEVRVWGPTDRVQEGDREILAEEIAYMNEGELLPIEIELIFRNSADLALAGEAAVIEAIDAAGGHLISRCRITDIAYHALLAELPVEALRAVTERSAAGISGMDPIMHIRPQSLASTEEAEDAAQPPQAATFAPAEGSPILALLDGVPVSEHPLLRGRLVVDDQFELEANAIVSERTHGTAMASLIAHGDRNSSEPALPRKLHCVPVLGAGDQFPSGRLIVDLIYQAVIAMRDGDDPTAPNVLIVNLSLGNSRKPFQGRLSPWARLIDRLAHRYGILFCVSAGNHGQPFEISTVPNMAAFEATTQPDRATHTLTALSRLIGSRRLLSPSETVNGISIGAANIDAVSAADRRSARGRADPYQSMIAANPSSGLGPGFSNSVKPDILMPGSREHLMMVSSGATLSVRPSSAGRPHGLKVAAPPRDGGVSWEHYTCGTSAAAALASRTAHKIHDALEDAYGASFLALPHHQRAALLKALLVHTAAWPSESSALIKSILGPTDPKQSVRQKENVRRFMGYGLVSPDDAIACASDRATFWAVGSLGQESRCSIQVPLPVCMNGQARAHSMTTSLAWFTPVHPGRQSYRSVKLSLLAPEDFNELRVLPAKAQPDYNQASKGTAFSRRWEGDRAPTLTTRSSIELVIQREADRGSKVDELVPFGIAVSVAMPGVVDVYAQARARLGIRPRPAVRI
jgi:Subtilase family